MASEANFGRAELAINRRRFLIASTALVAMGGPAAAAPAWGAGEVLHILPTASHERLLVKCSLRGGYPDGVALAVNGRLYPGRMSDTAGRFWSFDVRGLAAATTYALAIEHKGRKLCETWPLATFPAPEASPQRLRILTFTCAGGHEDQKDANGDHAFRSNAFRRRLLDRALSFGPDVVIANGDHIYWDQRSGAGSFNAAWAQTWKDLYARFTPLDRNAVMFGGPNERALKEIGDAQIADVYGVRLRSLPTFFIGDDHDYFENDEATPRMVTFPPDDFMVRAKQAIQRMYYPEMLPDPARPLAMSGTREDGLSENFGTLRYGRLFEGLLYDCGQWLDLKGDQARIVPEEVERWLIERTQANDTAQLLHVPSTPPGWSAGKWREWYPDVVVGDGPAGSHGAGQVSGIGSVQGAGRLVADRPKYMWQKGWFEQHQRIMSALTSHSTRPAVVISGDLHAVWWETITRSGDLDMTSNPVYTILAGTVGTSTLAFPSRARGSKAAPPSAITVGAGHQPEEKNGFTIIDVEPEQMTFRLFAWREPQPETDIDHLQPFEVLTVKRRSVG